jgi:dihydrofolate reductase
MSGKDSAMPGMATYVFSRTLRQTDYRKVTIVSEGAAEVVSGLRDQPGKDIWLFGGGELFRSLAEAELVDTVELAIAPVLLGGGIPLRPLPADRISLDLLEHKVYKNGMVSLKYAIRQAAPAAGRQRRTARRRTPRSERG